ncbi:MAG: Hsp70 family protein [Alphaproteobacteria bacterium]|nr:Hsp70 family protein [Alphaproteobacteria bacterium]
MTFSCGIDFGTTNTIAALTQNGQTPHLIALEKDEVSIPSALFFDTDKKIYYGRHAMKMYINGKCGRCMRSLKSVLGSDLMATGTYMYGQRVSFTDIIGYFLQNVKNKIDTTAGHNVENVVLGRPVHFRDHDVNGDMRAENELRMIATNIGFKNIEFQYEPIAAAFAHERFIENEKLACVIDIGGGTSDFTILRISKQFMSKNDRKDDILASTGVRIGGNNFDKDFSLKCFMPSFGYGSLQGGKTKYDKIINLPTIPFHNMAEWSTINTMYNYKDLSFAKKMLFNSIEKEKVSRFVELIEKEQGYSLLNTVENSKIKLTDATDIATTLDFISDRPKIFASRQEFEDSLKFDLKRIFEKIDECVNLAQIKKNNIQLVLLTGGSTEIPLIQHMVSDYFPNAELSQENKFSSVGIGLAYDSIRKFAPNNNLILNIDMIKNNKLR